jgi:hypothetical protein
MEQGMEAGTDREAESVLERFVGGDSLRLEAPEGFKAKAWIPAFAGMTKMGYAHHATYDYDITKYCG